MPVLQLDISSTRGIGVQEPIDRQEEVVQPSFRQAAGNGHTTVSFADQLAIDVGMSDLFVRGGWIGFQRHDPIGMRGFQLLPVQTDLERSQMDPFQDHRLGRHGDLIFRRSI